MTLRFILGLCVLLLLALAATSTPAAAQSCESADYVYNSIGYWHETNKWTPSGHPGVGDTVCVPNGKHVQVYDNRDEDCEWFFVASGGAITITKDSTLTVDANSVLNGDLNIQPGGGNTATLQISSSITISGAGGGKINLTAGGSIDNDGSGDHMLTLDGDCDDEDCSITMFGSGVVSCKLVNHAKVNANQTDAECLNPTIVLEGSLITGNGFWIAQGGGALRFDEEVSGGGTFQILNTGDTTYDPCSQILINDTSQCLTGDVELYNGTFIVNAPFLTSGNLQWASAVNDTVVTSPKIKVAAGATAVFDGVNPGTCP